MFCLLVKNMCFLLASGFRIIKNVDVFALFWNKTVEKELSLNNLVDFNACEWLTMTFMIVKKDVSTTILIKRQFLNKEIMCNQNSISNKI